MKAIKPHTRERIRQAAQIKAREPVEVLSNREIENQLALQFSTTSQVVRTILREELAGWD